MVGRRALPGLVALALAALGALPWAGGGAQAACRQALSLGLDVSGSVDRVEYAMQINGLADALRDPDVQRAFTAMPDATVRLHVYEWAGAESQRVLIDWVEIASPGDLDAVAARLGRLGNLRPQEPGTALGTAQLFGARALAQQAECWRATLDISADGPSNTGPRPRDVKDDPLLAGITINALVIGSGPESDTAGEALRNLALYFQSEVIRGPHAFVEIAATYGDYRDAITRKLVRELQSVAIGQAPRPPAGGKG